MSGGPVEENMLGSIQNPHNNTLSFKEQDQHDHRYLWREMEVDHEPDVYVKASIDVWRQTGFSYGIESTSKNCQSSIQLQEVYRLNNWFEDENICPNFLNLSEEDMTLLN